MSEILELVELAKAVAVDAGEMLRQRRDSLKEVREALLNDLKTEADFASEQMIRSVLEKTGFPIIGEELGGQTPPPATNSTGLWTRLMAPLITSTE